MTEQPTYIPGVCNLGRSEIRRRQIMAWVSLVLTFGLWGGLVALKVEPEVRLSVFGPAMFAAMGFLQAAWKFCAGFGMTGHFNMGPVAGQMDTVEQAEYRQKDRRTALLILGLSLLISGTVAVIAVFVP